MKLLEVIKSRRSVRSYKEAPVPKEDILKVLEAAIWAPSAGNLQPWEFVVVTDEKVKRVLFKASYGQPWVLEAPVVIVVCADTRRTSRFYGERGRNLYCIQDTAAAIQNMLLMAHYMGYGTCWVGAFDEEIVKRVVKAPEGVRPIALVTLGVPAEKPSPPKRRGLEEVVHWETF